MVETSLLLSILSWSLASASIILSVARRTYIGSFVNKVLGTSLQAEWFDEPPISLLDKGKAYRLVQMMPYLSDLENWGKVEYFAKASETVQRGAGDCDDKAILLSSFWMGLGLDPVVVIADTFKGGHAFVEMDGYVYDPTWDFWEVPIPEYYAKNRVSPALWFTGTYWGTFP